MSLSAISSAVSNALPTATFQPHGHRKGAHPDKSTSTTSTSTSSTSSASGMNIGQLPVGASTPLFNNILQSLTQTVGAATAVASTGVTSATSAIPATGTTSTAAANVQAFMHTLFQALKQDGLGGGTAAGSAASGAGASGSAGSAAAGAGAAAGSGQYGANLVSSLQTLIRQVGSAAGNATTANLSAAYQNLVGGAVSGTAPTAAAGAAASSTAASASSSASLQSFLNNLLQNLQSGGVHSLSGIGNNVNANV